jgi:hypothetical protein
MAETNKNNSGLVSGIVSGMAGIVESGLFKKIRDNAKRKKAQKIANEGGYQTLSDYQKSLIGYRNPLLYGAIDINNLPGLSSTGLILLIGVVVLVILLFRRK